MSDKPLNNLRFCSTGIPSEVRSEVARKIKALGGQHFSNLMSDVNYLIIGDNRSTEKYKFCVRKRADIKFLTPQFIFKLYQDWLDNLPLDLNLTIPLFKGLNVCISRINQDKYLQNMDISEFKRLLADNGGQVNDSLSKTCHCVISNEKSGRRYDAAINWGIPVIHPLWILHSIRRAASLEFEFFDIKNVVLDNIGVGACEVWDEIDKKRKRTEIEDTDDKDNKDENLVVKRKDPLIWKSIMKDQNVLLKQSRKKKDQWQEDESDDNEEEKQSQTKILKVTMEDLTRSNIFVSRAASKIFEEKTFKIIHFSQEQEATLKKVILSHSGNVSDNIEEDEKFDYIIIPATYQIETLSNNLQMLIQSQSFEDSSIKIITDWCIERSLHYKNFTVDQWGLPFNYRLIPDKDKFLPEVRVCISGFQGIELLHVTKLVEMIPNFNIHDTLNKERDILIVNIDLFQSKKTQGSLMNKYSTLFRLIDNNGNNDINSTSLKSINTKMNFAKQNSIPIISIGFLFEIFLNRTDILININNKNWCLYCPKPEKLNHNIKKLLLRSERDEVLDKQRREKDVHQKVHDSSTATSDSIDSIPKLPSPMRNKRNNLGRIVGRASVSQFNLNKDLSSIEQPEGDAESEVRLTQIGYDDDDDKLLKLMKGVKDTTKNNLTPDNNPRKRNTRAAYKDVINIDL